MVTGLGGEPTAEQLDALRQAYSRDLERLSAIVDVHRCDRLNGVGQTVAITQLWAKFAGGGSVDALAQMLAVAVDRLAERTWGEEGGTQRTW